jgi:hypothetical protein
MKKGFSLALILIVVGILVVVGGGAVGAYTIHRNRVLNNGQNPANSDNFGFLDKLESNLTGKPNEVQKPIPSPTPTPVPTPTPTPQPASTGASASFTYTQPQSIYNITLPTGWVVGSTFATLTYSTTTFNGQQGNVAITFGTGKDPLGGCSEASAVYLADRTISGCYMLQQNGSRILTRAYTKTSGNLPITIEAYINPPLATNQPVITQIIGTIDIR